VALVVGPVESERELRQILELQQRNLARNLPPDEVAAQGFVTVEHTVELLQRMHALAPSIVARDGAALAGYALVMPPECRAFIPVLVPMFERLDALGDQGSYYIMGQICVDKPWRGRGVFDQLYAAHRQHLRGRYDCSITEVALRNGRSLRAHLRVGFKVIERYRDATDDWAVVRWDWSGPPSP
jgi:hypothetical protein